MEEIILDLYLSREWTELTLTPTEKTKLADYIDEHRGYDPLGHVYHMYRLNERGKVVAEFCLRKYGRETPQKKGMAIESRIWIDPVQHTFKTSEIIEAIKRLLDGASIELSRDWVAKRKRLIIKNIDEALDSAPEPENEIEEFVLEYFSDKRKILRRENWVEIILWGT